MRDMRLGGFERSDIKVGELAWIDIDTLLVLERGSASTKIFRVMLAGARRLAEAHLDPSTRPTIEEMSARGTLDVPVLDKQLLFDSDQAPEIPADLEGMAVLSPTELLLVNDNDFGVEGAETQFWKVTFADPVLG